MVQESMNRAVVDEKGAGVIDDGDGSSGRSGGLKTTTLLVQLEADAGRVGPGLRVIHKTALSAF